MGADAVEVAVARVIGAMAGDMASRRFLGLSGVNRGLALFLGLNAGEPRSLPSLRLRTWARRGERAASEGLCIGGSSSVMGAETDMADQAERVVVVCRQE